MAKVSIKGSKKPAVARKTAGPRRAKRKSLAELNAWMNAHYSDLLKTARENCVRLTGRPAFGGAGRGKSA